MLLYQLVAVMGVKGVSVNKYQFYIYYIRRNDAFYLNVHILGTEYRVGVFNTINVNDILYYIILYYIILYYIIYMLVISCCVSTRCSNWKGLSVIKYPLVSLFVLVSQKLNMWFNMTLELYILWRFFLVCWDLSLYSCYTCYENQRNNILLLTGPVQTKLNEPEAFASNNNAMSCW